jgi:molybdenum cofactor guanylyltransferase
MALHPELTLGILAGGAGRRAGGRDKGWIEVEGRPAIERLVERFAAEAAEVVISANRNLERYRALGVRVVEDAAPGFPGPLAGVVALLQATRTRWLLTVPVDVETLPADLLSRIGAVLVREEIGREADALLIVDDDGPQPMFAAYPAGLDEAARRAFAAGERSVIAWQASLASRSLQLPGQRLGNRNRPGPELQ